ncbi:PREDICTED: uncharacterized protein LOC105971405 [Erythranthe guttata]|uniref:uncharacterized protein LOC105971405 n=1 Tax=Erythranthe guttata TaxID=4155 RepID=UPI00064DC2CB|nr:PREDICTED: uncharacterized protein LOC105971405 [Erythranthe guttata]|eukprot:XP_012851712.1 PREDICTED: uncharacterized protein LOC105971405 [Erythranthe guttata]
MSCIFWNCQGLGAPLTIHTLGDILRDHRPLLVFLSETRATHQLIDKVKNKWNLNGVSVDKIGNSGGLALMWQKDIDVRLISYSNNHIDAEVYERNHNSKWRVTGFYGYPEYDRKYLSWELIRNLRDHRTMPWLLGGDFNEILSNSEKTGGNARLPASIRAFRNTLEDCSLSDLGFEGSPFTWSNNRHAPDTVRCRLDRCCANNGWISLFPRASVYHLNYSGSDHLPIKAILRDSKNVQTLRKKRPFRFEATWFRRDDCEDIINQYWANNQCIDPIEDLLWKNNECRIALINWSKNTLRQPQVHIKSLHKKIRELQEADQTEARKEEISKLRAALEKAYEDNDMYWRQRSKIQWIREGDRNTRFFHSKATIRNRTNRMSKLKDNEGCWKDKEADIEHIITEHFEQIFKSTNPREDEIDEVLENIETRVTGSASQLLSMPFTSDEFGSVLPSRGLRQGDPLSPYLFICCAEALIAMVSKAVERGDFKGVHVAPTAPVVSNLCFADDTLIFGEATESYAANLKEILATYARVSGQEINFEKSTMMFSPSTSQEIKNSIHQLLGFQVVEQHDKYLGMPATMGKTKKEIFSFLRDRVWSKINGWGEKQLSKAGKEVLIKAVLQAIPSYIMSCFLLPNGLLLEIESVIRRFWWGSGANRGLAWTSWKELCRSKDQGGLGFRDMRTFNIALLVKQAWRVLTNPDLLLSKIISAKYFPHGYLLSADLGSRPSATWRSIWTVIPYLKMGIRRRIGNGADTSIWSDPWLRDGGKLVVFTRRPIHSGFPNRVSDIIEPESGEWDLKILHEVFWPVDVERILAVPVGSVMAKDRWIWHFSKHGNFTVRSCYHHILSCAMTMVSRRRNESGSYSGVQQQNWKYIWQLPIPPKIRMFLWRLKSNIIPTNAELFRRKISSSPLCSTCHIEKETPLHVILKCRGMEKVWRSHPFDTLESHNYSSIWNWTRKLKQSLDEENFNIAMVVAWKAWDNRNRAMKDEEVIKSCDLVSWCRHFLAAYKSAQICPNSRMRDIHPSVWKPPPSNVVKLNFDAAFPNGESFFSVGMVARDSYGSCLGWKVTRIQGNLQPVEGEALAALKTISMAKSMGLTNIILEGDCLQVINALNSREWEFSSFGAFVEECLNIGESFDSCSFNFVKRQGNLLAHCIAQISCTVSMESIDLPLHLANIA